MMSPDDPKLTAYAMGELTGAERAEVEAELARSEELRREVEEIRASANLLKEELKQETKPHLDAAHRDRIEAEIAGMPGPENRTGRVSRVLRYLPMASAAALVFIIAGFGWLGRADHTQDRLREQRLATNTLIARIHNALSQYQSDFGRLPPDTGYGLSPVDARTGAGRTYDAGALWRYLANATHDGEKTHGPYLKFSSEELVAYEDPVRGDSFYVVDPWGTPIGYIGDNRRVIHNRGHFDIFSAGPDRKTAQDLPPFSAVGRNLAYDEYDNDGDGIPDNAGELGPAALNGSLTLASASVQAPPEVLDDLNNWDPSEDLKLGAANGL